MPNISPRKVLAAVAVTFRVYRCWVSRMNGISHIHSTSWSKGCAMSRKARWNNAVENIDTEHNTICEVVWFTHTHEVAWFVCWQHRLGEAQRSIHFRFGFAHR